ncbi:MAG TPA: FMN-binding negative transcriptional regulator [Pseudonocardia sp.]|uniref:FMN-binding negative transcriptional regulator n=1 Tax=Pseudonocardia sp. TaxID=60912 RepID=UPI002F3E872E
MALHAWDAARDDAEWKQWLAKGRDFGQLTVAGEDGGYPQVVPLHFRFDGAALVEAHLAAANPVWHHLRRRPRVTLSVIDDYAYVPGTWRAAAGARPEHGVPTSFYAAVLLHGEVEIVDDHAELAGLLNRQLAHHRHQGAEVAVSSPPYGPMLAGIIGLRLHVLEVAATFKYDGQKSAGHRERVAEALHRRDEGRDRAARAQLLRRAAATASDAEAPQPKVRE